MRSVVAAGWATFVLASCSGAADVPTAIPSATATTAMATPSAPATATPSAPATEVPSVAPTPSQPVASPTANTGSLVVPDIDSVVATTVEALSVRRTPGTDAERIGVLALSSIAFVISGPVQVQGVPWYRLSGMGLPYASGCLATPPDQPISCPAYQGWVAGSSSTGDPWLEPATGPDCPEPPLTLEQISESGYTLRIPRSGHSASAGIVRSQLL